MDKLLFIMDLNWSNLVNGVISDKRNSQSEISKIKLRLVLLKGETLVQVTEYIDKKVVHTNLEIKAAGQYIFEKMCTDFKQCVLEFSDKTINILVSKKGQVTTKTKVNQETKMPVLMHNRTKQYLLKEGTPVDFLVRLGVMNEEGYVLKPKYDKFRQINRFLEFVDDIVLKLPSDREIKIIDFGCGKSYLTFAIYYFLHKIKGLDVNIVGLDLKEDVINKCNALAQELNYKKLQFKRGDIADYNDENQVDMVVTLHACDTATDLALSKAVHWNAKVILSVPCCQHEINGQIKNELLEPVLEYGILKEKISALITDGIRASALTEQGYDTQILEFIDMEHTPKNLLIRAVKKTGAKYKENEKLNELISKLNINPSIKELLK